MQEIPKIYTYLNNDTKIEYNVILTFQSSINGLHYCVYTDNTQDNNQRLRLYTAKYNPKQENPFLGEPTTKEEWNEICNIINNVIKNTETNI